MAATGKSRIQQELEAIRQQGLAQARKNELKDAPKLRTPEEERALLKKLVKKYKHQFVRMPPPTASSSTAAELDAWLKAQREMAVNEKKRRKDASNALHQYRSGSVRGIDKSKPKNSKQVMASNDSPVSEETSEKEKEEDSAEAETNVKDTNEEESHFPDEEEQFEDLLKSVGDADKLMELLKNAEEEEYEAVSKEGTTENGGSTELPNPETSVEDDTEKEIPTADDRNRAELEAKQKNVDMVQVDSLTLREDEDTEKTENENETNEEEIKNNEKRIEKNGEEIIKKDGEEIIKKDGEEIKKVEEEIKTDEEEIKTDEEEMQTNEEEIKTDEEEMQTNEEETRTDKEEIKTDGEEIKIDEEVIKTDEEETRTDEEEIKTNEEEIKTDEEEIKTDEEEIKTDEEEIRKDGEEIEKSGKEIEKSVKESESGIEVQAGPDMGMSGLKEDIQSEVGNLAEVPNSKGDEMSQTLVDDTELETQEKQSVVTKEGEQNCVPQDKKVDEQEKIGQLDESEIRVDTFEAYSKLDQDLCHGKLDEEQHEAEIDISTSREEIEVVVNEKSESLEQKEEMKKIIEPKAFKECLYRGFVSQGENVKFPVEKNRYELYLSEGCPRSHQILIILSLKGLTGIINVVKAQTLLQPTPSKDNEYGFVFDHEVQNITSLYDSANLETTQQQKTLPVLWDSTEKAIVNNNYFDIAKMLNSEFNAFSSNPSLDLYPVSLQDEINSFHTWLFDSFTNGIYTCAKSNSQEEYNEAVEKVTRAFDEIDSLLRNKNYLIGNSLTLADIALFTSLFRFDEVYSIRFMINTRSVSSTPNLLLFCRLIYNYNGELDSEANEDNFVAQTCNMDVIKKYYYHNEIFAMSKNIIPLGTSFLDKLELNDAI